jgi:succinate dehydrogenase / fumarate reductase cytochrome b subunit
MANLIAKQSVGNRPKNLDLTTIRLPINALVSIFHRLSGVVLFLMLPVMLWALQTSVRDEAHYEYLVGFTEIWWVKLLLVALFVPFFHHFYAGLRHLGQDVHWMTTLQKARFSGRVVLWLDAISVLLFGIAIW